MREWERATWAAGQTEAEVIRRVGEKIAERALQLTRAGDAILILAGKGHNGDDARAARKYLRDRQVEVLDVTDPKTALPEFRRRTGVAPVSDSSISNRDRLEARPALIIDGLFGIGLNRPLDDGWKKFIAAVNESKIPVLAVDVPSGLNADTGEVLGAAIEAAVTLTVGAPKTGCSRKLPGRSSGGLKWQPTSGWFPARILHHRRFELDVAGGFRRLPAAPRGRGPQRFVRTSGDCRGQFWISRRGGSGRARGATRAARPHHAVHAGGRLSPGCLATAGGHGECVEAGNKIIRRRQRDFDRTRVWPRRICRTN